MKRLKKCIHTSENLVKLYANEGKSNSAKTCGGKTNNGTSCNGKTNKSESC